MEMINELSLDHFIFEFVGESVLIELHLEMFHKVLHAQDIFFLGFILIKFNGYLWCIWV